MFTERAEEKCVILRVGRFNNLPMNLDAVNFLISQSDYDDSDIDRYVDFFLEALV